MNAVRIVFFLGAATFLAGFRIPCPILCTDQTNLQRDYVDARDECRQLSELKADMAGADGSAADDKNKKTRLVSVFSDCMNQKGWAVPGPAKDAAAPAGQPATTAAQTAQGSLIKPDAAAVANADEAAKRELKRAADCAYARQAAENSTMAAARAQACDSECATRIKSAPDAPRPGACPPSGSARSGTLSQAQIKKAPAPSVIKPSGTKSKARIDERPKAVAKPKPKPAKPAINSEPENVLEKTLHE